MEVGLVDCGTAAVQWGSSADAADRRPVRVVGRRPVRVVGRYANRARSVAAREYSVAPTTPEFER